MKPGDIRRVIAPGLASHGLVVVVEHRFNDPDSDDLDLWIVRPVGGERRLAVRGRRLRDPNDPNWSYADAL